MKFNDWLQLLLYLAALVALVPLLGGWVTRIFDGRPHWFSRIENALMRVCGVDAGREMTWSAHAAALLALNFAGLLVLLLLQLSPAPPRESRTMPAPAPASPRRLAGGLPPRSGRQILREIWGPKAAEQRQYPRVHIGNLRKKIEDPASPKPLLQTEPGIGYRLLDS